MRQCHFMYYQLISAILRLRQVSGWFNSKRINFFALAGYSTKASILLYLKQKQNLQFDKEFSSKSQCGEAKNAY